MDLAVFSLTTLLVAGVFVALRAVRLAAGRWWRWAGTAASVVCGAALIGVAVLVVLHAGSLIAYRALGIEPARLALDRTSLAAADQNSWTPNLGPARTNVGLEPANERVGLTAASVAVAQDLWRRGTLLFVVLGVVQGAVLGLALSVITEPNPPAVGTASGIEVWRAAFRLEAWRGALGKAMVTLPLPAVVAVLLTFYQENRDRFSSVEVGSFLRLALSPAPSSGPQQSSSSGGGDDLLYSTDVFVGRAQESLSGELRRRDMAFISVLKAFGKEARVPDELDFLQTRYVEFFHCDWLYDLKKYVEWLDDYNLLTLNIGEALSQMQIGAVLEGRELRSRINVIRSSGMRLSISFKDLDKILEYDGIDHLGKSRKAFEAVNEQARKALEQIGVRDSPADHVDNPSCKQWVPRESGPSPDASPPQVTAEARARSDESGSGAPPPRNSQNAAVESAPWTADQTRRRILDLHAPYRVIGIANFYAAIGSFETAYLVLRGWLTLDSHLRHPELKLRDVLPNWFRLRVLSEAAQMYLRTSQDARLSERYRRLLDEVAQEYEHLVPALPRARGVGGSKCFDTPVGFARLPNKVDPLATLALTRVTSEIEAFEVNGLSGSVSQRHVEDAKKLTRLDFSCFADAFEEKTSKERVDAELQLYEARAVTAWGRLAIRWVEAGKALKRVSDTERKAMLAEVRVAVGGVVERLEHLARIEENRRLNQSPSQAEKPGTRAHVEGQATLDHARTARRVLQEALALDQ